MRLITIVRKNENEAITFKIKKNENNLFELSMKRGRMSKYRICTARQFHSQHDAVDFIDDNLGWGAK